ncbi:hypothetical protein HPB48_019974 [Haemaphysalis longicornis]|uniref:Uncharacterized protein n=1 Tax=Haemaphysalis longicornis TaxID=44386 RepID=A0A9J6GI40_HAELO|nr:hypothetical protein HPB48_019974 [Haemaphysalis longicornis]
MCSELNLSALAGKIGKSDKLAVDMFCSPKTHKVGMPFGTIVLERGAWQNELGRFLQDKLKLFLVDDPFRIQNFGEVTELLKHQSNTKLRAFSVAKKGSLLLLPHTDLLECVEN